MLGDVYRVANGEKITGSLAYNIAITAILFVTVLFANFAEAIAEARGKAQPTVFAKRDKIAAKNIFPVGEMYVDEMKIVPSSQLRKGMYLFAKPAISSHGWRDH
jgi:K+-transporting ATPase ATPase B chain